MKYKPDEVYLVGDNVEAIRLIVEHGEKVNDSLLEKLVPISGANSAFHAYETEHHWCQASKHIDHDDDIDNGYMVVMIPKTKMGKEQAAMFFLDMVTSTSFGGITMELREKRPISSN